MLKKKPKKAAKKISALKKAVFLFFVVSVVLLTLFVAAFDKRVLPTVIEISKLRATSSINMVIADSVNKIITEANIGTADFYNKNIDQNGKVQTLSVNSVLIDSLCSRLAKDISNELSGLENESIEVPIGVMLGISGFSNIGPVYSVKIQPLGSAVVDYTSSFESAGINQINFQVWLQVNAKICIVNPLQDLEVNVERKVLLVNTVFSGEVPSIYLDGNRE